jgi:hypothetical protein
MLVLRRVATSGYRLLVDHLVDVPEHLDTLLTRHAPQQIVRPGENADGFLLRFRARYFV